MTTTTKENMIKEMKINEETVNAINEWLTKTRVEQTKTALSKWLEVGKICLQIKALKAGKFKDNCEVIFPGLTNDERQYSMKLYDDKEGVMDWYAEKGCMKYNPRTIFTAYNAFINPKAKPTKKKEEPEKVEDKELRKERKGIDAIKALVEYRRIRNNAAENGNLILGDLETLRQELENELREICEAIELEAPIKPAKAGKRAEKKAA